MNQIQITLLALFCCLIFWTEGLGHDAGKSKTPTQILDGIDVADQWLKLVDENDHNASWDAAAPEFREAVTKKEWAKTVAKLRTVMGPVKERNLFHDRFTQVLPGVPDGQYIVLRFVTAFEHKQKAMETVSLKKGEQAGDTWKVAGYFIR